MRPYSTDLRLKVVRAYERGHGSQRQLAQFFGVSVSFVHELLRRYRQRGSVEPKPHGGGKPAKLGSHIAVVRQLHQQQPDASLARRCEQLAATAGVRVSRATMQRVLRRLGLTRGKRPSAPRSRTAQEFEAHKRRTGRP
ncbi:MAG TPA: transposase [Candidatus Binatia bacterium]|nr:transposase [Candidatus Binatia bacterium]